LYITKLNTKLNTYLWKGTVTLNNLFEIRGTVSTCLLLLLLSAVRVESNVKTN